jgi:Integrase core domain
MIPRRLKETGVKWHYVATGKPQQNAFIDRFNLACATNC